jgi:hypothetical protein
MEVSGCLAADLFMGHPLLLFKNASTTVQKTRLCQKSPESRGTRAAKKKK